MALAVDAGALGGWGVAAAEKGIEAAKWGTRVNPIGIAVQGIFTPSSLGDGTIEGALNTSLDTVEEQIRKGGKSGVSDYDKANALTKLKERINELTNSCNSNNPSCNKGKHRGKVHSQDGADDIVSASEAGTFWLNFPYPPSLTLCKTYALTMRAHMFNIKGHSGKGIDFEAGATKAYSKMISWMKEKTPNGVPVEKYSFNFDGIFYMGGKPPRKLNSNENRRIDLDVFEGQILKSI